jgi:hypothetical protein
MSGLHALYIAFTNALFHLLALGILYVFTRRLLLLNWELASHLMLFFYLFSTLMQIMHELRPGSHKL